MPWQSRWSVDIPVCSLPTYLFKSPTATLSDKPIIIEGERPEYFLTLATYREWSMRFAAGLKKAGMKPGDRLLLFSGNTIFFSVVQMGTIMAGGIFTGANPSYVPRELAYQLKDSGAKFLIVSEANVETGLKGAKEIGFPTSNIFVFDDGIDAFEGKAQNVKGVNSWTSLLAPAGEASRFRWDELDSVEAMRERTIVLNYSSGTTGLPKGVEVSTLNYISNAVQAIYVQRLRSDYEQWLQYASGIGFLPMYHAYGQTYYGLNYPKMNFPVYIMRKFDFLKMLEWTQKYRCTNLNLVPPIVVALTKRKECVDYDLTSLEEIGCGAAPLAKESIIDFEKKFPHAKVRQGWGMTELTCSAVTWDPNAWEIDPTAVGELMPNVEAQIVDENKKEVHQGGIGEVWIRAPNVLKGYWGKMEATRDTKNQEGWLRTGDVGFRDEKGMLHVVDRKKELIKVKGLQVAPAELEGLLLDSPEVDDAAVVGVTIDGDELPRAYVVLKEGSKASPRDISSWVAEKVSRHKRLEGGVVVVDAIPKNPSGKLLRKELRDRAAKEVGDAGKAKSKL